MARKNIFEQLSSSISFSSEIDRLDKLLHEDNGVRFAINADLFSTKKEKVEFYSIQDFIDKFSFKKWKSRGTSISCVDMRYRLGIPKILEKFKPTNNEILTYLEFYANVLSLLELASFKDGCTFYGTDVYSAAKQNLLTVLDWLNFEQKKIEAEQKILIVEKNAAATAVAEVIDTSLAYKVIQYNHFSLKGDVSKKKSILLSLGAELEPRRKELSGVNSKLTDNIFYLFNNLNLRHNNTTNGKKNYIEYVDKLPIVELEKWYDELYQMCLLAFLELDQIERNKRFEELKERIECDKG